MTEATSSSAATIAARKKAHVLFPWTRQAAVNPLTIRTARGSYLYDADGRRYLDLAARLLNVNVGHQHPKIIEAIKHQADELCPWHRPCLSAVLLPLHLRPRALELRGSVSALSRKSSNTNDAI